MRNVDKDQKTRDHQENGRVLNQRKCLSQFPHFTLIGIWPIQRQESVALPASPTLFHSPIYPPACILQATRLPNRLHPNTLLISVPTGRVVSAAPSLVNPCGNSITQYEGCSLGGMSRRSRWVRRVGAGKGGWCWKVGCGRS